MRSSFKADAPSKYNNEVGSPTSPTARSERIGHKLTPMKGFVYILKDTNGKFYIGSTENIERRLKQHNLEHTQTTRNMKSSKLIHCQEYASLEIARKVERKIKALKRRDYIEKIVKDGYIRLTP